MNFSKIPHLFFRILRRLIASFIDFNEQRFGNKVFLIWGALLSIFLFSDHFYFNYVEGLSTSTYDYLVSHKYNKAPSNKIIIVEIDEASIARLSSTTGGWPWSRDVYTVVFDYLTGIGAQGVVFDLLITDPSRCDKDGDRNFEGFLTGSNNIFLPYSILNATDPSKMNLPVSFLHPDCQNKDSKISATYPFMEPFLKKSQVGFDNLYPENDGVVRSYRSNQTVNSCTLKSLSEIALEKTGNRSNADNEFYINWRPYSDFKTISFWEVFNYAASMDTSKKAIDLFKDKIIFIGATAPGLGSSAKTPLSNNTPGIYIQANAFENMLSGDIIRKSHEFISLILALLVIAILTYIYWKEIYIYKIERAITLINLLAILLFAAALNFLNYYIDLVYSIAYAFIYLSFASLYGDLKSRYLKGRFHFKNEIKNGLSYDFHLLLIRIRGITKKEKNEIVNTLQEACFNFKSEPNIVEDWMSKGTLMGKELSDSFIIYWLSVDNLDENAQSQIEKDTRTLEEKIRNLSSKLGKELILSETHTDQIHIKDKYTDKSNDFDKAFYMTFSKALLSISEKIK